MKKAKYTLVLLAPIIAIIMVGCSDDIVCTDLATITDPVQREKLIQQCPPQPIPNTSDATHDKAKPVKKNDTTYGKSPVVNWGIR